MRIIFLDVDGALNNIHSTERCRGFIGIEDSKVEILKENLAGKEKEIFIKGIKNSGYRIIFE